MVVEEQGEVVNHSTNGGLRHLLRLGDCAERSTRGQISESEAYLQESEIKVN